MKNSRHPPTIVRYNKNLQTISVSCGFKIGRIPVKLIAHPEEWSRLMSDLGSELVPFERVEALFSRLSKKTRAQLEKYATEWPDRFNADLWRCALRANMQPADS